MGTKKISVRGRAGKDIWLPLALAAYAAREQEESKGGKRCMEISAIMLTYNRERFVSRAVESILGQTFQDFELIIVDNGSTDQSGIICDGYAKKDSRIKVIHKEKGNIGSGRNRGLEDAKGKYIAFIDDDDYAYPDMLGFLYNLSQTYGADVAVCGSDKIEEGKLLPNISYRETYVMDAEQATEAYLQRKLYNAAMPTKLVSRSLFEKIRFSEKGNYDDITTAYRYFVHSKVVAAHGEAKYCFYRHEGNNSSAATKFHMLNPLQLREYLAAFQERTQYIREHLPALEAYARYSEWSYMLSMCEKIERYQLVECNPIYQKMQQELCNNWEEFYNGSYIAEFEKEWFKKYILNKNERNSG